MFANRGSVIVGPDDESILRFLCARSAILVSAQGLAMLYNSRNDAGHVLGNFFLTSPQIAVELRTSEIWSWTKYLSTGCALISLHYRNDDDHSRDGCFQSFSLSETSKGHHMAEGSFSSQYMTITSVSPHVAQASGNRQYRVPAQ